MELGGIAQGKWVGKGCLSPLCTLCSVYHTMPEEIWKKRTGKDYV